MKAFDVLYCIFWMNFISISSISAQTLEQYFDGADTLPSQSILMEFDNTASNIWQIGTPQKAVFGSALTVLNALVTDTINTYPNNANSSFSFQIDSEWFGWGGVLALQSFLEASNQ